MSLRRKSLHCFCGPPGRPPRALKCTFPFTFHFLFSIFTSLMMMSELIDLNLGPCAYLEGFAQSRHRACVCANLLCHGRSCRLLREHTVSQTSSWIVFLFFWISFVFVAKTISTQSLNRVKIKRDALVSHLGAPWQGIGAQNAARLKKKQ